MFLELNQRRTRENFIIKFNGPILINTLSAINTKMYANKTNQQHQQHHHQHQQQML